MDRSLLSFFQLGRRRIAGVALALLLQSLAWGLGAASSIDVLESEGANAAIHEQGCSDTALSADTEADKHCNEACHFWSQFQIVFAANPFPAAVSSPVLSARSRTYVIDNRNNPPFRPPRVFLPA